MMEVSSNLDQILIARRLMMSAQRAEDRRKGKHVDEKSLKEEMDADQALISGNAPAANVGTQPFHPKTVDTQIKLPELSARLNEVNSQQVNDQFAQVQVNVQQTVETQASLRYTVLEKVDGLVRRSQTQAETDRYSFEFSDGTTFKITDKWTNRSTTIWGDPHVDVNDVEGTNDGDFQDLKTSNSHTTFMLQDGTRVTFKARDDSLIESVDIFKGSQHLGGIGEASKNWDSEKGLFASGVDETAGKSASVPMGDTVFAGGDGNDWFSARGQLVWGKTTGPTVTQRPSAVIQFEYQEKISTQVSVQISMPVNKQA